MKIGVMTLMKTFPATYSFSPAIPGLANPQSANTCIFLVYKVHFHSDGLWRYIKHGCMDAWLPQSHQQNRIIMQIAAHVAGRYAGAGYFVVLDGVV